ncbi:MAG: hypothetical protein HQK61_12630, partial [Desulfamplus sp.]|nr:hypothetical protein [Desulfamplus sp.]
MRYIIFLLLLVQSIAYAEQLHETQSKISASAVADIRIETQNRTVSVNSVATFLLDLQPDSSSSKPVDLWFLGVKGSTLYYFDIALMQFVPGLYPVYQGDIIELNHVPLPVVFREPGEYQIYFAVDTIANGKLDSGQGELFYSMTPLTIKAEGKNIITYLYNGDFYRIDAVPGAHPENISNILNLLSSGNDDSINVSPNGEWYLVLSERFHADCAGWSCLTLSNSDFSENEVVIADNSVIHNEGVAAVDSTGNRIVYTSDGGTHIRDMWVVNRENNKWKTPIMLTGASPFEYNSIPSISGNGNSVLFECGNDPYMNKSICQVNLDGTGFRVIFAPDHSYRGARTPDYTPDGTVVAELDSVEHGETIFKIVPDTGQITPVNPEFNNDNSPCVLGNGNIASLWLNREGGNGIHELK